MLNAIWWAVFGPVLVMLVCIAWLWLLCHLFEIIMRQL